MSVFALITAAGSGTRIGGNIRKQYLEIAGQSVLERTIARFDRSASIDAIVVTAPSGDVERLTAELKPKFAKLMGIVPGGEKRADSVLAGLEAILGTFGGKPADPVLVHDGVRPFPADSMIAESARLAGEGKAVICAVPARDTLKTADKNGVITATLERSTVFLAQTPQSAPAGLLKRAFGEARKSGFVGTDEASYLERLDGVAVHIIPGDEANIKITTPADIQLAEHIALSRREKASGQTD